MPEPQSPSGGVTEQRITHARLVRLPQMAGENFLESFERGVTGLAGGAFPATDQSGCSRKFSGNFANFWELAGVASRIGRPPAKQARQRNRRASKLSGSCLIATIGERIANLKHGSNMKSTSEFGIRLVSHSRPTGRTSSLFSLRLLQSCASPTSFPLVHERWRQVIEIAHFGVEPRTNPASKRSITSLTTSFGSGGESICPSSKRRDVP
jgi:hypothetical protein